MTFESEAVLKFRFAATPDRVKGAPCVAQPLASTPLTEYCPLLSPLSEVAFPMAVDVEPLVLYQVYAVPLTVLVIVALPLLPVQFGSAVTKAGAAGCKGSISTRVSVLVQLLPSVTDTQYVPAEIALKLLAVLPVLHV